MYVKYALLLYTLYYYGKLYYRHCSRIWLKSADKSAQRKCCFEGQALDRSSAWPKLQPLSNEMKNSIFGKSAVCFLNSNGVVDTTHCPETNNIAHFSRNSARYNGIYSISATGVENGKGGKWEKIVGAHGGTTNNN